MRPLTRIFVYGTLRPGEPNARLWTDPTAPYGGGVTPREGVHLGAATVRGRLVTPHGAYPYLLPGSGLVHGDVLEVTPALLARFDALEGHPGHYTRTPIWARRGGRRERVQTYLASAATIARLGERAVTIASGDWCAFVRTREGSGGAA